jgi:hypothetical protein
MRLAKCMLRSAYRLCVFAILAVNAWPQQSVSDPAAVMNGLDKQITPLTNAWLKNDDPHTQAWGAYLALRDRRVDAVPALVEMLAKYSIAGEVFGQTSGDRHDAMLEVLDALIQLGARVPAAEAQRIYPDFPIQSLILLSRSKIDDASPALFSIFKSEQRWPIAWLAAGNLLAQQTVAGFAAAVFEGMTVHAQVIVVDPNHQVGGGEGGSCFSGDRSIEKTGWPPVGLYKFGACGLGGGGLGGRNGATILAGGTDPATYHRTVATNYTADDGPACLCDLDRDLMRQHYLTRLVGASVEAPPIHAHVSHTIIWQGPDAYVLDVNDFVAGQQREFGELARRLARWRQLNDEEVKSLRPALQIEIQDRRASQGPSLPKAGPFAANVTIDGNAAK